MPEPVCKIVTLIVHQIFTYRTYYMSSIVVGAEDIPVKKSLFLSSYILEGKTENDHINIKCIRKG